MIDLIDIPLFDNLSQSDISGKYFDFHNDFDCVDITFSNKKLVLNFLNLIDKFTILISFYDVTVCAFDLSNIKDVSHWTIDNIYRGKTTIVNSLVEVNSEGSGYFYIDFVDGQIIELWASSISFEKFDNYSNH